MQNSKGGKAGKEQKIGKHTQNEKFGGILYNITYKYANGMMEDIITTK